MKELALLMFFVGCGYALAKLIERFSPADGRRIFFAIPSQTSFNVLWGFVFYLGFAALVIHHHHWLRLLFALTAVCLLGIILYRRELFRSVSVPEGRKFTGRLEKALLRQQQEDRRLNRSYSRTEALSVLSARRHVCQQPVAGTKNENAGYTQPNRKPALPRRPAAAASNRPSPEITVINNYV